MSLVSAKRNRNDNFQGEDVDLLLSLVNEYSKEIDNPKIEVKKMVSEKIGRMPRLIPA
jgi:hypothetical protein